MRDATWSPTDFRIATAVKIAASTVQSAKRISRVLLGPEIRRDGAPQRVPQARFGGVFQVVDDVIAISLPSKTNANHSHLLILGRAIKTLEKNKGAPFNAAERRSIFNRWHDEAGPFLRGGQTREEYFVEFLHSYRSAKHLIGETATTAWE